MGGVEKKLITKLGCEKYIFIYLYVLQGHILNTAGDALTVPCWFLGEITKREREREERVHGHARE
jgi:hypothetical protein